MKESSLESCVAISPVYESPLVRIIHWRCLHDGEALRAERCHEGDAMTVIEAGASLLHSGGRSTLADSTRLMLHQAGVPYRTSHPLGCGDSGYNVTFGAGAVSELLGRAARGRAAWGEWAPAVRAAPVARPDVALLLRHRQTVYRLRRGLVAEPLELEELTLDLLAAACTTAAHASRPEESGTRGSHQRQVERVRELLAARFREPLRLDEIAREVAVSPYHLSRLFKRETGSSIHQYRNRLRLLESLERLAGGADDLTTLALEMGFSSHSHFSASFRRFFGSTPARFRTGVRLSAPRARKSSKPRSSPNPPSLP